MRVSNRLLELDALRGIAAILVILFHFTMGKPQESVYTNLGLTGVELFFMISGFVILMTLEKIKSSRDFILGRIFRLYPTYFICVSFTALLIILTSKDSFDAAFSIKYLANMTMFQTYFLQGHLDGPYWTMGLEMLFYIFMFLLYQTGLLKRIEFIGALILVPLIIYGIYFSYLFPAINIRIFRFAGLINFFPLFLSGIVYYNMKFHSKTKFRYALLALCFITQLTLFHTVGFRKDFISLSGYMPMLILYNGIFVLYLENKLVFIVNKFTLFLGGISYPLYLIHQFVSLKVLLPFLNNYFNFWVSSAISFSIVILLAYFINSSVEKPFMKFAKSKWLKKSGRIKTVVDDAPADFTNTPAFS